LIFFFSPNLYQTRDSQQHSNFYDQYFGYIVVVSFIGGGNP